MQIWQGNHGINSDFNDSWQKAKATGITRIDAYARLCNNCAGNNPLNICSSIKKNLPNGFDGMLWLDIEGCDGCWKGTPVQKLVYSEAVAAACAALGIKLGIYSGKGSWANVFGSYNFDAGALKALPLWYSHYDGVANFNDWGSVKFGGWAKPSKKQYQRAASFCGTIVDFSVY